MWSYVRFHCNVGTKVPSKEVNNIFTGWFFIGYQEKKLTGINYKTCFFLSSNNIPPKFRF